MNKICLVVSSPMTVNAFLRKPIHRLSELGTVFVIANMQHGDAIYTSAGGPIVLPVRIERNISPWLDFLALLQLISLFRRYRFQIVHSVTPKAGLIAMLAARLVGTPVRIHTFTGQVWGTRHGIARRLLKGVDKLIAKLATHVLADSPSQLDFLLRERVITKAKSGTLANGSISGVDISRFHPNEDARRRIRLELGILESELVFLFLGRLNRDKGILDLATAFAGIADKYPHAHLLIVGPDEGNTLSEIAELVSGCRSRVHCRGFAKSPEDYMVAADVFCLPSYREGFGSVIIEAAAVGIPAIASRIYGVVDAVEEGQTGLLFPPRDVSALQFCMRQLADSSDLRLRLGEQARVRALSEFSSEIVSAAWIDYYRKLPL